MPEAEQQNLGQTDKIEGKAPSPEQLHKKDSAKDLSTAKKADDEVKQEENSDYENAFDEDPRTESKGQKEKSRYDNAEEEERVDLSQKQNENNNV